MTTDRPANPGRRALFFRAAGALAAGSALAHLAAAREPQPSAPAPHRPLFEISLAQWSLNRALFADRLDHLDFPKAARDDYAIHAVEYVNAFFKKKGDAAYNAELRKRCDDLGVRSLLIMCDGEGALGDPDDATRLKAVENHRKWLDAAKALGCHSIRVNAESKGDFDEQQRLAADGLRRLCELADPYAVNVIVENHWGLSSDGRWLAGVMQRIDHPRCGTLPDFGNFDPKKYDRYQGVRDLMPFAKGVSAKSYDFNDAGDETTIDYPRMLGIVLDAGYRAHIGIEYEGNRLSEPEGIRATKKLLERLRDQLHDRDTTP